MSRPLRLGAYTDAPLVGGAERVLAEIAAARLECATRSRRTVPM